MAKQHVLVEHPQIVKRQGRDGGLAHGPVVVEAVEGLPALVRVGELVLALELALWGGPFPFAGESGGVVVGGGGGVSDARGGGGVSGGDGQPARGDEAVFDK